LCNVNTQLTTRRHIPEDSNFQTSFPTVVHSSAPNAALMSVTDDAVSVNAITVAVTCLVKPHGLFIT
jgi:hypothetical protein